MNKAWPALLIGVFVVTVVGMGLLLDRFKQPAAETEAVSETAVVCDGCGIDEEALRFGSGQHGARMFRCHPT